MCDLPEGWAESVMRMGGHCANTYRGDRVLSYADMRDAAVDGIVAEVVYGGWPDGGEKFTRLFNAGKLAIDHAVRESRKHLHHWSYWYEPPGAHDALAEAITDRVGIRQLCQAFTEREWAAVWALSETRKHGGGPEDAAGKLGITVPQFHHWLEEARARARRLWVAPGESLPGRQWHAGARGKKDPQARRRDYRARAERSQERRNTAPPYTPTPGDRMLTGAELEALTGIPRATVKMWAWEGHLPARGKRGKAHLYSLHEFKRHAARNGRDTREQEVA